MSDSISFGVAPALLVFGLFSQWGQNTPLWTISVVIACCWVVICTMLRLARFQHESELDNRWFHGLASPASAVLILSLSGLVYLLPEVFVIDSLSSDSGIENHSPLDWMIIPGMAIAGTLMISDRRLPKFSKGTGMNLSLILLLSMFIATLIPITGLDSHGAITASFLLLAFSLCLIITHVLFGPKICDSMFNTPESEA